MDFGCGNCVGSYHLKKEYGAHVVSYDKSQFSEEMANNIGLVYVREIRFETGGREVDEKYDLIYSSHSLEHVPDLLEWFSNYNTILNSGGHVLVEVPNIQGFEVLCRHRHIPHTWMLNERVLSEIASSFGLKLVDSFTYGEKWSHVYRGLVQSDYSTELAILLEKIQ